MVSSEWVQRPFEEVIDFREGPGIMAKDFRETGVPLIRLAGLNRGASVLEGCNHLDPYMVETRWKQFRLTFGDVLLSSSASLGRIAVVGNEGVGAVPYTGIIRMRPRDSTIHSPFIRYLLEGPEFQQQSEMVGVGSVIRHFGPMHLKQMTVKLPPLPEQRAIAHILGTLDDKIELDRRMNQTLEEMARAIFQDWFVDFGPVRAKLEGREPYLPPELWSLFPDRLVPSELGEIPEGWEVKTLGDVTEIHDNVRVPLNNRQRAARKGKYRYYGAAGVMDFVDGFLFDGIYVLTGEDGSVAEPTGRPVTQYVWGQFWVNNHAHVLKGNSGVSDEHLYLLLREQDITAFITGAVQPKLSQKNLKSIPVAVPPLQICEGFDALIQPMFATVRQNTAEIQTLSYQRDTLLPKLVSGELQTAGLL